MIELSITATDDAAMRDALLVGDVERCAVLFATQTVRSDGRTRLLVRDFDFPKVGDYLSQQADEAVLRPDYVARVTKRAKREALSLVFVHTHPGSVSPHFSATDDQGEGHLARFLAHRNPQHVHAALVLSRGGLRARQIGTNTEIRVVVLGEFRIVAFDPGQAPYDSPSRFDRQVRAFGADGQREIARLRIGIVGLGGTGSIIAQQLVHLGVREFILIDPDTIDETNLNRVVGTNVADVGAAKVDVAGRYISTFAPEAVIARAKGDIVHATVAKALTDADVIFGCTDSHGSRAVMQQIAYQYLIPCIDMGSTITTEDSAVSGIFGRVQMLTPGFACFTCSGLLNPEEVRRDMMSAFEKKQDPYIQGAREPAPAVISLNGTVASLAITMFLALVTGIPSRARYLVYNAMISTLRAVRATPQANCYICSRSGTLARGDSVALQARQD